MPTVSVPAPGAPPQCNLTPRDVKQFVDALAAYHAYFAEAFRRPELLRSVCQTRLPSPMLVDAPDTPQRISFAV